jgi:hypothetical protein
MIGRNKKEKNIEEFEDYDIYNYSENNYEGEIYYKYEQDDEEYQRQIENSIKDSQMFINEKSI